MDRVSKLMVFLIVAVTLPALLVAGPPRGTQKCEIDGDIVSDTTGDGVADVVEIGIGVGTWILLDDDGYPASLFVKGSLLQKTMLDEFDMPYCPDADLGAPCPLYAPIVVDDEGYPKYESCIDSYGDPCDFAIPIVGDDLDALLQNTEGYFEYYGHARVLKKNGWLDFEFGPLIDLDGDPDTDLETCVSPTFEDLPFPWGDPTTEKWHLCPYELFLHEGLYDRKTDVLRFDFTTATWVSLVDYSLGELQVRVGEGPDPTAGEGYPEITVEFQPDGDGDGDVEDGPENTSDKCQDKIDNDGDGKIDCADPNCKKFCP